MHDVTPAAVAPGLVVLGPVASVVLAGLGDRVVCSSNRVVSARLVVAHESEDHAGIAVRRGQAVLVGHVSSLVRRAL
jgi:hypothetical protein